MNLLNKGKVQLNEVQQIKYRNAYAKQNAQNGKILLSMIIIFELILIIFTLTGVINKMPDPGLKYIYCYIGLIVISIIALIFVFIFQKNIEKNSKKVIIVTVIYAFLIVIWSLCITILDNSHIVNSDDIAVNITILFVLAVALYVPITYYISIVAFNYFALLIADLIIPEINFGIHVNLIVLSLMCIAMVFMNHNIKRRAVVNSDIIEKQNKQLKELNDELLKMSITDGLTGLYNRLYLDSKLKEEWQKALDSKYNFTIALLDIDDFKQVNDNYGHMVGDMSIVNISNIIKDVAIKNDGFGFRYGGEEFLLVLPNKNIDCAYEEMEKMRIAINEIKIKAKTDFKLCVSIGLYSSIPNEEVNEYNSISYADKALYQAKESGKNRTNIYKD